MDELAEQNRVLRARVADLEAALEADADPLLRSLLEQERSLRLAIEASRMGMWRWDVATSVVTWDDRLLRRRSGLGLANVAARVRDAGGAISCESVSGAGSTFTVLLPPADKPASTAKQAPAPGSTKSGATILLVDDEPLVRSVLRRLLEREGYEIHEATSAADARDFLKRPGAVCDLVILDQSMPRESGLHALPSMRALTRAPVVLFTGMAPQVPSDVAAVLQKPALPAELYRVVREVLSRSS